MSQDLTQLRVSQGEAALLSLPTAARLLGFRGARAWLEQHVLIRRFGGQQRVLWADVIAATSATPPEPTTRRRRSARYPEADGWG